MKVIINSSSLIPLYEQIMESVKKQIISGDLSAGDALPSVRALAGELRISALTVKKAYDRLEAEGYTNTIHGKGTYVTGTNPEMLCEQRRREIEAEMDRTVRKARGYGIQDEEIRQILEMAMTEED